MIEACYKWVDTYCGADTCRTPYEAPSPFECSSVLLGALMKQMKTLGIMSPRPVAPFDGLSVNGLRKNMDGMKTPRWFTHRDATSPHSCTLDTTVCNEVLKISLRVPGLKRSDFVDRDEVETE